MAALHLHFLASLLSHLASHGLMISSSDPPPPTSLHASCWRPWSSLDGEDHRSDEVQTRRRNPLEILDHCL